MTAKALWVLPIITAGILVASHTATAQQSDAGPLYLSLDCMKSTATDYVDLEKDIWQAMHQELVNRGKRTSWALYAVEFGDRSKCDYYTVTTFTGEEQLNADPAYEAAFEAAHPRKSWAKTMARTLASRERVSSELWVSVDSTEIKEHRFAIVNMMYARDPDVYERMESDVFKPGHQTLVDGGHRAGWSVYTLVSPIGTSVPYNYSTVDFVNELGPAPMAESMITAHPGLDLEEMHEMLELREHVSSETWARIAGTE